MPSRYLPSETSAAAMSYKDEEATKADQTPEKFAVRREDSASTAAGHMRLDLVDDKLGKCSVNFEWQAFK